ncbi:hypothetical protein [Variovorax sp. dw_954]|uniref:hypothetical protein n=1 Tax=Variovorax sp. dw_954 TaxID=2720078 RepID=UPI001BD36754|nr:hypothetical protein [Variovorax sp. dw_954]
MILPALGIDATAVSREEVEPACHGCGEGGPLLSDGWRADGAELSAHFYGSLLNAFDDRSSTRLTVKNVRELLGDSCCYPSLARCRSVNLRRIAIAMETLIKSLT